ncbi:hypothetical protein N9P38_01230 [Flavobacteriales bacterium]|nr:hypothetical protein [Flavobacteriales bacterium]MDA9262198.1 hypothetical protein [bacterium]MDB4089092.1 hypothetical protein [Flavobacteriales bacterium]
MKFNIKHNSVLAILGIFLFTYGCKKNEIENPYNSYSTPKLYEEPTLASLPTTNFGYLHATVFKPTCANSGCHDGAFEPDFRTITSSYNNSVYHNVLTNNPAGDFTYRVKPGDAALSLLHERLITALPNTSGIMPAVSGDEWVANKASHINGIKTWINNGAKDMYGNTPAIGNPNPIVTGFNVYDNNNTTSPKPRAPGAGLTPILVPRTNVDFWFSVDDDSTPGASMTVNQAKVSTSMFEFDTVPAQTMSVSSSITANDFSGTSASFTHKLDVDLSSYASGTLLFVRVYVQDADHSTPAENPSDGSSRPAIYLFTLYLI